MNGIIKNEDCIITDRGGMIENKHLVNAAVVDTNGKLLDWMGNPQRVTLLRSAAKPAQALAIVETGALEKSNFDNEDLALMCASHSSQDMHVDRARSMLKKIHASEDDLRCGGHPSITPSVNQAWVKEGFKPTAINNNCSGKHTGMLAGSQALNGSMDGYHLLKHPMQQRVKSVVEELSDSKEDQVGWGIDGCNLPAPGMSLERMALIYARLAAAPDLETENKSAITQRTKHLAQIYHAMTTYPELVGGEERFCTALMRTYQGALVGKVGADGCYAVAIRSCEQTKNFGSDGAIGIAVKIEDGNREILYSAVVEILKQLQVGTPEMWQELDKFHHIKQLNTMGIEIGSLHHEMQLHPSRSQ